MGSQRAGHDWVTFTLFFIFQSRFLSTGPSRKPLICVFDINLLMVWRTDWHYRKCESSDERSIHALAEIFPLYLVSGEWILPFAGHADSPSWWFVSWLVCSFLRWSELQQSLLPMKALTALDYESIPTRSDVGPRVSASCGLGFERAP